MVREGSFKLLDVSGHERILGPACVFGELELLKVHAGDVVAGELGGSCFAVSSMAVMSNIRALTRALGTRNVRFLSAAPLFQYLDASDLAMLGRYAFSITHSEGACVYREGQMPKEFLYVLKSGCLVSHSTAGQSYIYPGECLDVASALGGRPHTETIYAGTESEAVLLAFSFQLLRDVFSEHLQDFLWRCVLLSMLNDTLSHQPGFSNVLMWRDDAEAFARACVIQSFPSDICHIYSDNEAESVVWCGVLDGALQLSEKNAVVPYDATSDCRFALGTGAGFTPKDRLITGRVTDHCTLALLLRDAVGTMAPPGEKLEVVKNAMVLRNLDRKQQTQLAQAGHLLLRPTPRMAARLPRTEEKTLPACRQESGRVHLQRRRACFSPRVCAECSLFQRTRGDLASHFFVIKERA